ncbi:MAG: cell wall metabolism sensor histidine kinase WalK [Acetatifactor sp.]|nr:cell wall metabolism sensor histidine kinase WalK [Acetatifactor sp.]
MKTIRKLVEMIRQKMPLKSLRLRIFAIVLVVGLVPGLIVGMGIVQNYEDRAVEHRISTVQNQLKIVANHLISNDYMANYRSEEQVYRNSRAVVDAELEMLSNLYEGRVMIINSNFKVVKDTYGISQGKIMISEEVIKCFRGESLSNYDPEHGYIEMTTPIMDTTANSGQEVVSGVMLTSISNGSIVAMMEMLNRRVMIIETLLALAIVVLAIVLAVVMTRPFNRITQAIMDVNSGYSDESISVTDYAETVHIVDAFNQLLARMRALDQSRQEFVANVSHELKTPMTSIKVLADSLLVEQEVPAQLYREFMEDIVSEIDRENRIITDLLALVKMDKKVQDLNITSLNINDLVELILKRLRPIARKKDVEVVFESMRPVVAEVDEVKMTLIMTNLVENSIKYNKEHGWVKVELDADHQFFTFKVSDSGIGIPEDALAHICERFYRVDKSHSREIGGTGLGLAITKSAVLLHRGTLTINSVEGEGSSFVVKIPLIYIVS